MDAYLFGPPTPVPEGFTYKEDFITPAEEQELMQHIRKLELEPFRHEVEGQIYEGKRRVTNFGEDDPPFPDWLIPLRDKAAAFAGHAGPELVQAHLIEYSPGSPIGWHRDAPPYRKVIGVSLNSACRFMLRRKRTAPPAGGWDRYEVEARPRSIYVLAGAARSEWQHGIPPVENLRYSITFRTVP